MTNENTVSLKIVTPEGVALEEDIEFARFPGKAGEIGVYPSHSATLAELKEGFITLEINGEKSFYFVSKGYLHIRPDHVLLMTPFIEKKEDIDKDRALKSQKRAQDRLKETINKDNDHNRARQSLLRSKERVHILSLS